MGGEYSMTKRWSPKAPWETDFKPYAEAIGYLIREWNGLQTAFLKLFRLILANPNRSVATSIWHTIQNDRIQRQILAAVAAKAFDETSSPYRLLENEDEATMRHLLTEITWCMQRANELGNQRDNAIHTPFSHTASDPITFVSNILFDHPRAKSLKGKDLLNEFYFYRKDIETLTQ